MEPSSTERKSLSKCLLLEPMVMMLLLVRPEMKHSTVVQGTMFSTVVVAVIVIFSVLVQGMMSSMKVVSVSFLTA